MKLSEPPAAASWKGSSLELRDLSLSYGPIDVLRGVSLRIAPGSTTCIIGPSGSGKSTLLRGINRLHEPKSGDVLLAGRSVLQDKPDALRLRIGMVFQHFNLFPDQRYQRGEPIHNIFALSPPQQSKNTLVA